MFYAAGWELARRGIIRPGITSQGEQITEQGNAGDGYTVTPRGREWLDAAHSDYSPMESGRFATMLASFDTRFGPGFHERSHEALRCYSNLAYVACCAMCGAAAESILLAAAIATTGDDAKVLHTYESRSGRSAVENMVIGQRSQPLQQEFRADLNLLKYWRDSAAHGQASNITEIEAHTSLALLLRFAQFVNNRWAELTAPPSP